jgi:hypothetical protein
VVNTMESCDALVAVLAAGLGRGMSRYPPFRPGVTVASAVTEHSGPEAAVLGSIRDVDWGLRNWVVGAGAVERT